MVTKLSRDEMIALVRRLQDCEGTSQEQDTWAALLADSVPHTSKPGILDMIFWPAEKLTPEQIVDQALAAQPIPMPAPGPSDS